MTAALPLGRFRQILAKYREDQAHEFVVKRFNPNQPRVPAGSAEGGEWSESGGDIATATPERTSQVDRAWQASAERQIREGRLGAAQFLSDPTEATRPPASPPAFAPEDFPPVVSTGIVVPAKYAKAGWTPELIGEALSRAHAGPTSRTLVGLLDDFDVEETALFLTPHGEAVLLEGEHDDAIYAGVRNIIEHGDASPDLVASAKKVMRLRDPDKMQFPMIEPLVASGVMRIRISGNGLYATVSATKSPSKQQLRMIDDWLGASGSKQVIVVETLRPNRIGAPTWVHRNDPDAMGYKEGKEGAVALGQHGQRPSEFDAKQVFDLLWDAQQAGKTIIKFDEALAKFNPDHEPAGSPAGGQFARRGSFRTTHDLYHLINRGIAAQLRVAFPGNHPERMTIVALARMIEQHDVPRAKRIMARLSKESQRALPLVVHNWFANEALPEDAKLFKFNPHHKPAGPGGGQFASASEQPEPAIHPIERSALWGSSHGWSSSITAVSLKMMDVTSDFDPPEENQPLLVGQAKRMLAAIASDKVGSPEVLYHGYDEPPRDWKVGQIVTRGLTATSGGLSDAASYGVHSPRTADDGTQTRFQETQPTVLEFPAGTPMQAYSRWRVADAKDFGHQYSEAIVAGRFEVTGVRRDREASSAWWRPEVVIVSLRPIEVFEPTTKRWHKVKTARLVKRDTDGTQPRDDHGRWSEGGVPALPGTTPIAEGRVRRFHVTSAENLDSIQRHGLQMQSARGIEGPRAIYGWDNWQDAKSYGGDTPGNITVEYTVSQQDDANHPVAVLHDIPVSDIVAIHEPWHEHYRYAKENAYAAARLREIDAPEYQRAADQLEREAVLRPHQIANEDGGKKLLYRMPDGQDLEVTAHPSLTDPTDLVIDFRDARGFRNYRWKNQIGPRGVRSILRDIAQLYPDASTASGTRVSGARAGAAAKPYSKGTQAVFDLSRFRKILSLLKRDTDGTQARDDHGRWSGDGYSPEQVTSGSEISPTAVTVFPMGDDSADDPSGGAWRETVDGEEVITTRVPMASGKVYRWSVPVAQGNWRPNAVGTNGPQPEVTPVIVGYRRSEDGVKYPVISQAVRRDPLPQEQVFVDAVSKAVKNLPPEFQLEVRSRLAFGFVEPREIDGQETPADYFAAYVSPHRDVFRESTGMGGSQPAPLPLDGKPVMLLDRRGFEDIKAVPLNAEAIALHELGHYFDDWHGTRTGEEQSAKSASRFWSAGKGKQELLGALPNWGRMTRISDDEIYRERYPDRAGLPLQVSFKGRLPRSESLRTKIFDLMVYYEKKPHELFADLFAHRLGGSRIRRMARGTWETTFRDAIDAIDPWFTSLGVSARTKKQDAPEEDDPWIWDSYETEAGIFERMVKRPSRVISFNEAIHAQ